jgi:signal transduction histidine kinase
MMRRPDLALSTRLIWTMAALLLAFGLLVATLVEVGARAREQESLQRLSHGLARHIVGHWPQISQSDPRAAEQSERKALLSMLMVVNPGIQVYLLDADGRVATYLGEPGMVREHHVDLEPIRAFLAGASLPVLGTDPMGGGVARVFSAAMFPPRSGDDRPPGYLYVVLDGQSRDQLAGPSSQPGVWRSAVVAGAVVLVMVLALGVFMFRRLTMPLRQLAAQMRAFELRPPSDAARAAPTVGAPEPDEVRAIAGAFDDMRRRIGEQDERERRQSQAHLEMMAGVAHDLRTPLTALHGHLEALGGQLPLEAGPRERVLQAALAQSNKVRRLSQQLFELAALQSPDQVLHREVFRLDELVADAVQKFELAHAPPPVTLAGESPGSLEFDGDLHLIERALTNLIDNAVRHAPPAVPVRVSLRRAGGNAQILVEDAGPGLPDELARRLQSGQSPRDAPALRTRGGIGGLGLAIAQRVAVLHGGSLRPMFTAQGGTTLCLVLPLSA